MISKEIKDEIININRIKLDGVSVTDAAHDHGIKREDRLWVVREESGRRAFVERGAQA